MKMSRKRRTFTDKFKAKVALEAIKGIKTLNELASEYQLHPNQISDWKKQLLANAPELFSSGQKPRAKTEEELTASLYEEIGRLKSGKTTLAQMAFPDKPYVTLESLDERDRATSDPRLFLSRFSGGRESAHHQIRLSAYCRRIKG
jgi:putative transposase